MEFAGRVQYAKATLRSNLSGNTNLVKIPLTAEQLLAWKEYIEQCAKDFIAGRADVNPREQSKTCERCGLQSLCRVQELRSQTEDGDDPEGEEAGNE